MHRHASRLGIAAPLLVLGLIAGCGIADDAIPQNDGVYASAEAELNLGSKVGISRAGVSVEWARRNNMPHGIAGSKQLVFVTEPLNGRVVALDRLTGREVGEVTPPAGEGFLLPFTARAPFEGRLVVLDSGGFPDPFVPAIPRIYDIDYTWNARTRSFTSEIVRTVRFDNLPVVYAEDFEVLPDGHYVMGESVIGALWVVTPEGNILPGIVPSTEAPIPEVGPCFLPPVQVDGLPFGAGFAPGAGSVAYKGGHLYFGSTCLGGLHRVPVATLLDQSRTGEQKAQDIETVSPGTRTEVLKGIAADPWNPDSRWIWAADPFQMRFIRIDVNTGAREVVSDNKSLFNFAVSAAFLPPLYPGALPEIAVASDQEHRFTGINPNIPADSFKLPFILTKILVNPLRD